MREVTSCPVLDPNGRGQLVVTGITCGKEALTTPVEVAARTTVSREVVERRVFITEASTPKHLESLHEEL